MSRNEERYLLQALEFEGALRASLWHYTRNDSDVDELLQETYGRLLTAAASDEPEVSSVRAFALTITRDVALDWLRHRQIAPIEPVLDLETPDAPDESDQVDAIVQPQQELAVLVEAMQALPERCRQVFTLRKVYGYSQREIASRLHISETTVEQHLTRAARRCTETLFDPSTHQRRASGSDRWRKLQGANEPGK